METKERKRDLTSKVLLLGPQKDYFCVDAAFFNLLLQSKKNAAAAATAAASASSTPNSTEFNVSNIIDFFEYRNNFCTFLSFNYMEFLPSSVG